MTMLDRTHAEERLSAIPTSIEDRSAKVDAIRGFALCGVVVMNFLVMAGIDLFDPKAADNLRGFDAALAALLGLFVSGKAMSLFAILFGFGYFAILQRAAARRAAPDAVFARRMAVLAGFGLLNMLLVFAGDILMIYAVLGLLLLPAARLGDRGLLWLALASLILPPLVGALLFPGTTMLNGAAVGAALDAWSATLATGSMAAVPTANATFYFALLGDVAAHTAGYLGQIYALFLLGMWIGRKGLHLDVEPHRPLLRRAFSWGIGLWLVTTILSVIGFALSEAGLGLAGDIVFGLGLSQTVWLAIAIGAVLLRAVTADGAFARILAPAGRMPLTLYLLHGLVGALLFHGWAGGLIREVGVTITFGLGLATFALLVAFAHVWARSGRRGPAETLWRHLTYFGAARAQPR